jgi:pyruvate formate lyase activating enzyme
MTQGLIFNIQRFSLHDGPGVRTTVFLKGCPLSCSWCQNPEGISMDPLIVRHMNKCLACLSCFNQCPAGSIKITDKGPVIDQQSCRKCFGCADVCPAGAIKVAGKMFTTEALTKELLKDRLVFEESGGGVTFSGGEPFMQPEFLLEMLKSLKNQGIHTAIETCGHTKWENIKKTIPFTDLYLYDLKFIDEEKCARYTGVSGQLILSNFKKLTALNPAIIIRIPLIPGINDDHASLLKIAEFLKSAAVDQAELIPYHNYGERKYDNIGCEYKLKGLEKHSDLDLENIKYVLGRAGIKTENGGGSNVL